MVLRYAHPGRLAADWVTLNPVLRARELGVETDTRRHKWGDGATAWNSLPYSVADAAPAGTSGALQYNNAGAMAGAADARIEGGQLRLPIPTAPAAPAANGVKLLGPERAILKAPHFMRPDGKTRMIQPDNMRSGVSWHIPNGDGSTVFSQNRVVLTAMGTLTAAGITTTSKFTRRRRVDYLQTVAAVGNIAGFRSTSGQVLIIGAAIADEGGFLWRCRWGIATGASNTAKSGFTGLRSSNAVPANVNPSTLTNLIGMGWDAADTQMQFIRNDGAGSATKVAMGASFPVPTTDRDRYYDITMYQAPGTTQSLEVEVHDPVNNAFFSATYSTDIPAVDVQLASMGWVNSGAVSAVSGYTLMGLQFESDN